MDNKPWLDFSLSHQARKEALIKAIPFYVIINRKIEVCDLYESGLFWINDEGFAYYHFRGLESLESSNAMMVYSDDEEVETAWQKQMKQFYDDNYLTYKKMTDELEEFRDDYQEMFI